MLTRQWVVISVLVESVGLCWVHREHQAFQTATLNFSSVKDALQRRVRIVESWTIRVLNVTGGRLVVVWIMDAIVKEKCSFFYHISKGGGRKSLPCSKKISVYFT